MGIDKNHLGPLLISIVMEKLSNVMRLQISRKLGKDNWDIEEFVKCIDDEISARETFQYMKLREADDQLEGTSSSLVTSSSINSKKQCIFCGKG